MGERKPTIDINLMALKEDIGYDSEENQLHKKRRYMRHAPEQIKRLEEFFIGCPHPNTMEMDELGKELGLEPLQVKYWFQNKRAQGKTKQENQEHTQLRAENNRLRQENIKCKEALESVCCPCNLCLLRMENARLKEEFDRVVAITTQLFGRPITTFSVASSSSRDTTRKA